MFIYGNREEKNTNIQAPTLFISTTPEYPHIHIIIIIIIFRCGKKLNAHFSVTSGPE